MMSDEKFILDATAGFRMMWFNKHEPHTIYLDQRPECEPDIIGDYRNLKEFPDETFSLVVFDPNHRTSGGNPPIGILKSYGEPLTPETWPSNFRQGFKELWRVLKPNGILIFKWTTYRIKAETALAVFPVKPLFGQCTSGHGQKNHSKTFWFCFMKFPEAKKE